MNANANIVNLKKGPSDLVRPKFSPGLLLRDDDLRTGVEYTRNLSRLLFRSLFGCGVVCGLEVTVEPKCGKLIVTVARGVALNGMGDPIYVPTNSDLTLDPTCGDKLPPDLWVTLCRTEKCCAPRSTMCGCEEEDSAAVCTREQEMFEIRIVKVDPDKCSCMCPELGLPDETIRNERQEQAKAKAAIAERGKTWECACANPCDPCYEAHYAGTCECCATVDPSRACDCCKNECVVLAYLKIPPDGEASVDHSVRRFVRPVLMRDPVVRIEQNGGELCPKPNPAAAKASAKKKSG